MANSRHERLTPSGFARTAARRKRRWPWVAGATALALITLAWFDGGEEPLRPIAEDVALPEQPK